MARRLATYKIVELNGCNTTIDTRDDLLGNGHRVYMVHVKTVTEPGDSCRDLVELDAFLTSIWAAISLEKQNIQDWTNTYRVS